ncbi:MAG: CAP domain-containing protein [Candidatus Shapirobacteria bacterium]|nr:CAP domain-containing protein [Candidatus Shapirobacteria bacterium]
MDSKMGTPSEILAALNVYRQKKGSQALVWDDNLGKFAQDRADYLATIKSTDGHKGFEDYLKNDDGYVKLGFNWLGENISYGYRLEAVHIIEWMYAGDKPHDDNQSDPKWDHVGIGVKDTATCLVFATAKR